MVNTIWFRVGLIRFWKDFSVCKRKWVLYRAKIYRFCHANLHQIRNLSTIKDSFSGNCSNLSFTSLFQNDWMYFLNQTSSLIPEWRFLRFKLEARICPPPFQWISSNYGKILMCRPRRSKRGFARDVLLIRYLREITTNL